MLTRKRFHEITVAALEADGWTVTHDPLLLLFPSGSSVSIDISEQFIQAERGTVKIGVLTGCLFPPSRMEEARRAIGEYLIWAGPLSAHFGRHLYLAVPESRFAAYFTRGPGLVYLSVPEFRVRVLRVDTERGEVNRWLPGLNRGGF